MSMQVNSAIAVVHLPGTPIYTEVIEPLKLSEQIFKNFSIATESDKQQIITYLDKAYVALHAASHEGVIPNSLFKEAAQLFFIYGRIMHAKDWNACASLLLLSIGVRLAVLNQIDQKDLPSLKSCGDISSLIPWLKDQLEPIHRRLIGTASEVFVAQITPQNSDQWFAIAEALRWYAGAKQNMDEFALPINLNWFEKMNGLARDIWARIDTQDSHWWIGQLIYNTGPFLYDLKHPDTEGQLEHIQGSLATLKELPHYLEREAGSVRAQELRAQIKNIKWVEYRDFIQDCDGPEKKRELLQSAFEDISEARALAEKTEGFNPFLKLLFLHNRMHCATLCVKAGAEVAPIEEMEQWVDELLTTMERENYNHIYHFGFILNVMRFYILQKNREKTATSLALAQRLLKKYPQEADKLADLFLEIVMGKVGL